MFSFPHMELIDGFGVLTYLKIEDYTQCTRDGTTEFGRITHPILDISLIPMPVVLNHEVMTELDDKPVTVGIYVAF